MFQLLIAFPHFLQSSQSVLSFLSLFHYPLERALTVFDRYLQLRQMVYRILLLLIQCHGYIGTLSLFEPHQECLPLTMFSSVWQNSFGKIDFLPNAMTRRHFDQQHENTYSSEIWLLDLLLLYCLRHPYCLVIVDIFSPSHQAHLRIRVCLIVLGTCACAVSLQAPFLNGSSALRNIFLLKSSNGTFA